MVARTNNLYQTILHQFRHLQKRNRAVSVVGESKISLVESHLLTEIDSAKAVTGMELAQKMNLPKQEVSRLGGKLIAQGLVAQAKGPDRRAKLYSLTATGQSIVKTIDEKANILLEELLTPLTSQQRKKLEELMREISDVAKIEKLNHRPQEHPLRVEIRRITRALTLLKAKVFDSPLNPTEWHILSEIQEHGSSVSLSTIAMELNLSLATVSSSLKQLRRRNLVIAKTSKLDSRIKLFSLSARGMSTLLKTSKLGEQIIKDGLEPLAIFEAKQLSKYLEKITKSPSSKKNG